MKQILITVLIFFIYSCEQKKSENIANEYLAELKAREMLVERMAEINNKQMIEDTSTSRFSPVKITSVNIESYSDKIEVKMTVFNTTDKTLDGLRVGGYCFNNFEENVNRSSIESNFFNGSSQRIINPGEEDTYVWDISEFSGATKMRPYIRELHFTDGTKWNYKDYLPKDSTIIE